MKHFEENAEGLRLVRGPSCAIFQRAEEMELMMGEQRETEMRAGGDRKRGIGAAVGLVRIPALYLL